MTLTVSPNSAAADERRRLQARARRLAKRAETLANEGRMEEAIACQSEVADLRPNDSDAFLQLGLLYREARRIDPAVHAFRRASNLNPAHRDPREALIEMLLEAGRYDETIAEGKALIRVVPRSLFGRDILSVAYLQTGQLAKSLEMTSEMLRLDPLNPGHHIRRAMLFQQQGNVKSAIEEYLRVLEMASPHTELFTDAEDALSVIDDQQMHQIVLLATEDRLFRLKLRRNLIETVQERGFSLSAIGFARLRMIAQEQLPNLDLESHFTSAWGGLRLYN